MTINQSQIRIDSRILNAFENDSGSPDTDYKSVYIYHDGNNNRRQVTLARGFTDDGGNLKKVIERYIAKGGLLTTLFRQKLDKFGRGLLADDREFIGALHTAAAEQVMQDAQDEIFTEAYLQPALAWGEKKGFTLPLSFSVIIDSYLHSGQMTPKLVASFSEHSPSSGGDEKIWIKSYLAARLAWFERVHGALHNTVYRPKFFLAQIAAGNWAMNCPLVANGSKVC